MSEPLREADAPKLSEMLTSALPHHPVSEHRLRRLFFRHNGFDPALARCVRGTGNQIDAFGATVMLPAAENGLCAQLLALATRPERRRCGLMRGLYAEIETELRRRGVRFIVVGAGPIPSGLDLRYKAAATLLLRRLYVPTAVGYDMTLDPDRPVPAPPEIPGFAFRNLLPDDAPALDALCAEEFPDWRYASALIGTHGPSGVVGAFSPDGLLVSFAGWTEYIFGPTGTRSAFRRLGLGEGVFWRAIHAMRRAGYSRDILIGFANIGYYARAFGCHIRGTVWRMHKDLAADPAISKGK